LGFGRIYIINHFRSACPATCDFYVIITQVLVGRARKDAEDCRERFTILARAAEKNRKASKQKTDLLRIKMRNGKGSIVIAYALFRKFRQSSDPATGNTDRRLSAIGSPSFYDYLP
jgi:hypothetical protein